MSTRGGYPVHDALAEHCKCWSCENNRRVKAAEISQREKRTSSLAAAANLVVIHVTKDVYEMHLGDRSVNGRLAEILHDPGPWGRPAVDAFAGLPLLEQNELLQLARDRKLQRIRCGDVKFSKDVEAEEAALEAERRK